MTTIVATRDAMYSDSKVSIDSLNLSYPTDKIFRCKDGSIAGAAGNGGDCSRFLEWAKDGFKGKEPTWKSTGKDDDYVIGLVLRDDGIYIWMPGDPLEKINADFFAVGSGGKPARVAMLLGKTPEEAMALVFEVDPGSGGPLQKIEL